VVKLKACACFGSRPHGHPKTRSGCLQTNLKTHFFDGFFPHRSKTFSWAVDYCELLLRMGIKENVALQCRYRNIKVLSCLLEALVVTLFNGFLSCFKGALTSLSPFLF